MILRYVRLSLAMDACRLGWLPLPALDGTPHGRWSVLMAWLCECEPIEPAEARA